MPNNEKDMEKFKGELLSDIMGTGLSAEAEDDDFRKRAEAAETERSGEPEDKAGAEPEGEKPAQEGDPVESDGDGGSEDESVTVSRDEWNRKIQESDGRLQELRDVRTQLYSTNQSIENLRQQILAANSQPPVDERQAAVEKYGEEIVNHPSLQYINERIGNLEERITGAIELTPEEEAYEAQVEMQKNVNEFTATDVGYFSQTFPDFPDAYNYAREARRRAVIHLSQEEQEFVLREEEKALAARALAETQATGQYVSPAKQIYDIAVAYGYEPAEGEAEAQGEGAPVAQTNTNKEALDNARRIAAGVASSEGNAVSSSGKFSGVIKQSDYPNLPERVRMQLASDPVRFKEMMQTGQTTLD